jgi:iron complex transport system substrate-binding protein
MSELLHLAGGRNVGEAIDKEYCQVSPEWVISRGPEVIVCAYMSPKTGTREAVANRAGWQHLPAVRNGAVYGGFDNDLLLRPGPRVMQGIAALREVIVK